jgi:CRISPR-associated endonuclease/helicase Cas3
MSFQDFFVKATGYQPFQYQFELGQAPLTSRVIRVPTGGGKTEAAILPWLWKLQTDPVNTPKRLVIFTPMRAQVTQTTSRIQRCLHNLGLPESHVAVVELAGEHPELRKRNHDWTEHPERPTILIGTVDLLLSAALNRGYAMSRFRWPVAFGLLNNSALWIVDEVQLMGSATKTFAQLQHFRELLGTIYPVVTWWMSATVEPGWLETVDFQSPPPITPENMEQLIADLGIKYTAAKPIRQSKVLDAALVQACHRGKLTLVVANTVKTARELYHSLNVPLVQKKGKKVTQLASQQPATFLIHSRFRPIDRKARMDRVIAADTALRPQSGEMVDYPLGAIVITTQIAEAGLDVSAHTMITELAPWASMVQRFGRLNRTGQQHSAQAVWVDVKDAAPYTEVDIKQSRERIKTLEDVSLASLASIKLPSPEPENCVIRQHDLVGLFSTDKDLAGGFTDISAYIRDSEERDVYIGWRDFKTTPNTTPQQNELEPHELCPVPISEAMDFHQNGNLLWEWDDEVGLWEPRFAQDLVPGMTLLSASLNGGYSAEIGWTGVESDHPTLAEPSARATPNSNRTDETSVSGWRELTLHLADVEAEAQALANSLALDSELSRSLCLAALWHDVGKALPAWQSAAKHAIQESKINFRDGIWAKFPATPGTFRPGIRHEEASALYAMQLFEHGEPGWSTLAVYLIACHHGKVRTSLGTYGVKSLRDLKDRRLHLAGFVDQPTQVNCAPMAFSSAGEYQPDSNQIVVRGKNWTALVETLVGSEETKPSQGIPLGPFRLAFLEALIVAADVRASAKYGDPDV